VLPVTVNGELADGLEAKEPRPMTLRAAHSERNGECVR